MDRVAIVNGRLHRNRFLHANVRRANCVGIRLMIAIHTINGIVCLVTGMLIIFLTKGTSLHRRVGWVYVVSLYMLCLVSFSIKDTTPFFRGFGMFHVMSLASMATVSAGFLPVLRRKTQKNWYSKHFDYMLWSYVGLIMAFNSHFIRNTFVVLRPMTRSAGVCIALTLILLLGVPFLIGSLTIPRKVKLFKRRFERGELGDDVPKNIEVVH
jgi:uncharacterized membrane protein